MTKKLLGLAIASCLIISFWAMGCQEKQVSQNQEPDLVKTHRLIAAENGRFRMEIEALRSQLEQTKKQLSQCEQQKELAGKCEEEKQQLSQCEEKIQTVEKQMWETLEASMSDNAKLKNEVWQLKAELAKLNGENTPEPQEQAVPEQSQQTEDQPQAEEGQTQPMPQ